MAVSFVGSESLKPEKPVVVPVVVSSGGFGVVETLAGAEEKPKAGLLSVDVVVLEGAERNVDLGFTAPNPPKAGFWSAGLSDAVCCDCCGCWPSTPNVGVGFWVVGCASWEG